MVPSLRMSESLALFLAAPCAAVGCANASNGCISMAPVASAVEVMSSSRRERFRFRMTLIPDSIGSLSAYFDHLIGERQQFIRHLEAERLRGLEVDDKLELCRLYQWQVRTL